MYDGVVAEKKKIPEQEKKMNANDVFSWQQENEMTTAQLNSSTGNK